MRGNHNISTMIQIKILLAALLCLAGCASDAPTGANSPSAKNSAIAYNGAALRIDSVTHKSATDITGARIHTATLYAEGSTFVIVSLERAGAYTIRAGYLPFIGLNNAFSAVQGTVTIATASPFKLTFDVFIDVNGNLIPTSGTASE